MLCARQYFLSGNENERSLSQKIDKLWREVEWNFYRGEDKENVLVWHWSPNFGWKMNFRIRGYNETLITYILAASSPTYGTPPEIYHEGWADGGKIRQSDPEKPLRLFHQGNEELGGATFLGSLFISWS